MVRIFDTYTYKRKDFLMTPTERRCFDALVSVVRDRYYVFPQVHLDELVEPEKYSGRRIFSFRHINQKSVDFVLCDKEMRPLLAIELNDWTHELRKRKLADYEKERIFSEAGLPLLSLAPRENFDQRELVSRVKEKLPSFSVV